MKTKERIFHVLLFELIALVLLTILAVFITGDSVLKMTGLAVALSVIAMCWNYIYNLGFDKIYGSNRIKRSLSVRLIHGGAFELGMMIISFPVIMWWLAMGFWQVLLLDIGAVAFFLLYSILYNWVYDQLRFRLFGLK